MGAHFVGKQQHVFTNTGIQCVCFRGKQAWTGTHIRNCLLWNLLVGSAAFDFSNILSEQTKRFAPDMVCFFSHLWKKMCLMKVLPQQLIKLCTAIPTNDLTSFSQHIHPSLSDQMLLPKVKKKTFALILFHFSAKLTSLKSLFCCFSATPGRGIDF